MKQFNTYLFSTLFVLALLLNTSNIKAQSITTPDVSPYAQITQRVGITDISIAYHSPAVKERKIWGGLVKYNAIWRAGANENTLISFTDPVTVENVQLDAGTYGLYMKPKAESVDIIFSSSTKNWGSVPPTKEEVVATVTVKPQMIEHQEWLSYDFLNRGGDEVTAALKWEKWLIPFNIKVDVNQVVLENIRAELKGQAGFGFIGREQAARYCLNNDVAFVEALQWIEQSINAEKRFSNLSVKSNLLSKTGDVEGAKAAMEEAFKYATPVQMNFYGYQLLNNGDAKGALEVFLKNVKNTPENHSFYWGFIDSVGEAYLNLGDNKNALKYYKLARKHAPESNHKYLDDLIKEIQSKK